MGIIARRAFGRPFVEVMPTGDPESDVWCVGEAPGRTEHEEQEDCNAGLDCEDDCQGHVFCGDSGATFNNWLERAGIPRSTLYVTNTVPIWPGALDPSAQGAGSAKPTQAMVDHYRPHLLSQIKKYNPKYIIGLGAYAYRTLLAGTPYAHLPMEKISGRPCEVRGRLVFAVTHPAAGLHNPFDAAQTWLGLRSASDYIHGRLQIPKPIKKHYRVLRGYEQVARVLRRIPAWKRALGIGVDTEGYPGRWWSLQFEVAPGEAYLIYANDKEGLRAFNKYAPRPFKMHNGMHDLDPIEDLGIECGDGDWEDTLVKTYVCGREPAKGDADSSEGSVRGQGLKPLSFKYLFEELREFSDLVREPENEIVRAYLDKVWLSMLGPDEPEVVNKYHLKPTDPELPWNDVNIMRGGGPWGNPFPIVKANKKKGVRGRTRNQAIKQYREWVVKQPKLLARLPELIGKRLVCCCKPQKCHGDVLAKMVAALPGKLHIPRTGKGQPPAKRILNLVFADDTAVRWRKIKADKKTQHWVPLIEAVHGPTPQLKCSDIPHGEFIDYACTDPDVTARLDVLLTREMDRLDLWQPYWIDMGIVPMLRSMNKTGLLVDRDRLAELERDAKVEHAKMEKQLIEIGKSFDMPSFSPNSNDDIAVLLYERMRVQHRGRKTPSGSRLSVEEKVLMSLQLDDEPEAFAFRKLLLDYKEVFTLLTRYIYPLPGFIYPDGRIHPEWRHTVTVSGRLACGGKRSPNLLAFPSRSALGRRVRNCFVAPPGYVYLSADLSQIELRVLASESGDPVMRRAFLEGRDMHADAAESAFGIKKDKVSAELWDLKRTQAKELNFGAAYGLTGSGYQMRLAMKDVNLDLKSCERAIAMKRVEWKVAFDFLASAGDELEASPDGIVRDMWDRIRYLPMIWSPVTRAQAEARRQAGNMKIQGGAQGVEKLGMKAWWDQRGEMPDCSPLLQIHDDVVFEINEDYVEDYAPRIQQIFSEAAQAYFDVPILTGIKYGESWGQMKDPKKA